MRVYIFPEFKRPDKGEGGIRRVVEAQHKYLPEYGIEFVNRPEEADVVNCHATEWIDHPVGVSSCHGLYWTDNLGETIHWPRWALNANLAVARNLIKARKTTVPSKWVGNAVSRGTLVDPVVAYHGVEIKDWEPAPYENFALWNKNRVDPICNPEPIVKLAGIFEDIEFISTFGTESHNLTTTGRIPFDDMKNYISTCRVYIATTRETGGIGTLEAMAAGRPALAFNTGANAELIIHKETGYIAEYGNWEDLAAGFKYCWRHYKRLGQAARQHVIENFQWKDRIGVYADVYRDALESYHEEQNNPAVSVIITAYNLEEYLPDAVNSVIQQDFEDWELIIVDDASPDNCGRIADRYAEQDKRIKVIHNPTNQYLAQSRNIGIEKAKGRYIIPLDADDMLGERALGILSRSLDQDQDIDIVTGSMEVIEPDNKRWVSNWPIDEPSYDLQIKHHNMVPYASMYRKRIWQRVGGYRRRMKSAEDAEFWTRTMSFGARPAKVTNLPTLIYRIRKDSMSHTIKEPDWLQWFTWEKYPEFTPFGAPIINEPIKYPVYSYDPPKVSVIIPVGPNHVSYIQDAADSILAQTFNDWELIIVNDTGKPWFDENDDLINPFIRGLSYATIVDSKGDPQGTAYARNRGIEIARAPYFVLLDVDDYAQPGFLRTLHAAATEFGGWVYPDWIDQNGELHESLDWSAEYITRKMLGPSTGIYPRNAWEHIGGFDEDAPGWEDWIFQLSLLEIGCCGNHLEYAGFTYNYNSGDNRERDYSNKNTILTYIRDKFKKLYGGEIDMGCRGCGGGKRRVTLSSSSSKATGALVDSGKDMVTVEYTGPQTQYQTRKSHVHPEYSYRFGGPVGHPRRRFYAFKEDAERFAQNVHFKIVKTAHVNEDTKGIDRQVKADVRHEPAAQTPIGLLDLDKAVVTILQDEGYDTIETLKSLPDSTILSIPYIGESRLRKIKKALEDAAFI